jgi:site-specific recombinase XerD
VQSYAHYLKVYWEWLTEQHLEWRDVNLEDLSEYMYWLRVGDTKVVSMQPVTAIRSEKTVNHAMTAIHTFYEFHLHLGNVGSDRVWSKVVGKRDRFPPQSLLDYHSHKRASNSYKSYWA